MKSVKYLLALVALCAVFSTATAQLQTRYFYVGVGLGATNYKGDLDDNFTLKFTKPGLTFLGGYKFHPHLSARLMLSQGWMKASDAKAARDVPRLRRNLSFRSPISEASLTFVWEFFANNRKFRYRTQYTPYIFGGVAVFRFNPQAKLGNTWYDLQPLGTEGQNMINCHQGQIYADATTAPCPKPYKLVQIAIPFGVGLRYKLTDKIDINAELGLRKTFTDYIDDVSGYYVNVDQLRAESGEIAAILSDRIDRSIYPQGGEFWNGIRGDNSQTDWYVLSLVSATYILDWAICPKFR